MYQKELPIFFDQTGRRWRKAKWFFGVSLVGTVVSLLVLLPMLAEPAGLLASGNVSPRDVHSLQAAFKDNNTPVLGRGQFIRAVEVKSDKGKRIARDVFSGGYIRELTREETLTVNGKRFALLRYGQLADRQIALTFDDGPDPAYTPQLLDVLSKHQAPATFFAIGANVVKHPEVARRLVREGHTIGNHTFSHLDFDFGGTIQSEQEINQTSRVLTAATSRKTAFMRVPYGGATDQSLRNSIKGILQAQRLGYTPVAYDYDTRDWTFKSDQKPNASIFDGSGKILLLHDSGGNRSHTVDYVKQLLPMAEQAGYGFVSLAQVSPTPDTYVLAEPSGADRAAFAIGKAILVLPSSLMFNLFALNVVLIFVVTGMNIVLAISQKRRTRRLPRVPKGYRPRVSVVVPAYNEASVLEASVRSVLASRYRNLDVVVVDDGSSDGTFEVAKRLAAASKRVKALHQRNRGKSAALNNGIRHSSGEIIICIDADTLFTPSTVWRLVRHFHNPKIGAVAGYVRAGNIRGWLTRWQSLEYITSITLERSAQARLNAITVVPGACGAWRKRALVAAGKFSDRTLAEDCDVALAVHQAGYSILQDNSAISYTECPLTLGDLARQRFRWTFGNIQSFWKQRGMFFNKRYGWLGMYVLPIAALSILLPMLFWPLLLSLTAANLLAGRWWVILLYMGVITALQFVVAMVGILLAKESLRHLLAVPITRLVYGPLRTYILYRSLLTALRGALVSWNKLNRTKTVTVSGRTPPFRAAQQPAEK